MTFSIFKLLNERSKDDSAVSAKTIALFGNRFLLLKNKDNTYELPGGHIKKNEATMAGAIREFQEETGIYPLLKRVVLRKPDRIIYIGNISTNKVKISNEHKGFIFINKTQLKKIKLSRKTKIDFNNLKFLFKDK